MALRIAVAYFIIGCAWVLLGDAILEFLMGKQELTSEDVFIYNIAKGIAYILVTGLALYFFTSRGIKSISQLEKQYRTLFEDNPNPMWVFDLHTLKILAVNNAAVTTYGYSKEEFLQLGLEDIRPEESTPRLYKVLETLSEKDHEVKSMARHKKKNGEIIYVNIFTSPVIFNNRKSRMVMSMDITEKYLAEERNRELTQNLTEYKDRLDTILNTVSDVVYLCGPDFKVMFMSDASLKLYGYSPEEFYTREKLWDTLVHPDDRELAWEQMKILLLKGNYGGEYRIINKSGELRYVYDKAAVKYDENRQPIEVFGVVTDITDLRQSEEKFKNYSERIAYILDNISDGFITLDENWRITYVNKVFQKFIPQERSEYFGKNIWEAYPPLTNTLLYNKLQEAVGEKRAVNFEEQYFNSGRWFRFSIYPNPEGIAIFFTETTETHKMQEEIEETQNNLNALINNTPDFIWSIDKEFRVKTINAPYRMFFKSFLGVEIREGDLLLFDDFGEEMRAKWTDHYSRGLSGKYFVVEDEFEMPTMGKIYFETSFNPIRDGNGEVVGLGCFSRDITLQKMTELRISEQNRQLLKIAWMQSHEIRGPLSVIMGLSTLFNYEDPSDPDNKKILEMLEEAAKKLDDVVSKIVIQSHEARKDTTPEKDPQIDA